MTTDQVIILISSVIGAFAAIAAAILSYMARHNPVPSLDFSHGSVRFFRIDDGRYAVRLYLNVTNISGTPALIEKYTIENMLWPQDLETIDITAIDGGVISREFNRSSSIALRFGLVLSPSEHRLIDIKTLVEKKPKRKINVAVYTPNKTFKYTIKLVSELERTSSNIHNF